MPDNSQIEEHGKRFRIKPFDGEFAPEFEGMTPSEILARLDDEYYAKKLAGGTEAYEALKAKFVSHAGAAGREEIRRNPYSPLHFRDRPQTS